MNYKTEKDMRALQLRKLRNDYDYIWQLYGKTIPTTKAQLIKYAKDLTAILDDRLTKAKLFRSSKVITKLPENLSFIEEDIEISGVRKK